MRMRGLLPKLIAGAWAAFVSHQIAKHGDILTREAENGAEGFTVCRFPSRLEDLDQLTGASGLKGLSPKGVAPGQDESPLLAMWNECKQSKAQGYHPYSGDETVRRARGGTAHQAVRQRNGASAEGVTSSCRGPFRINVLA